MADRSEHRAQAELNRSLAERLLAEGRRDNDQGLIDWAVTVAFYSAVHCVEAALADHGLHPKNHRERFDQMLAARIPEDVGLAYDILKDLSEQGRYERRNFDPDIVERTILGHYLRRVLTLL